MKLKIQGYGQVVVILAANNIIPIGIRYMKNKICLVSYRSICSRVDFFTRSHNLCELTTYFTDITCVMSLTPSFSFI